MQHSHEVADDATIIPLPEAWQAARLCRKLGATKAGIQSAARDVDDRLAEVETLPAHQAVCLRGWRILAVDDDLDSLNMLATLLRLEGADVHVANSTPIALDLLQLENYDLLISDIGMPGMDGHELVAEVRRRMPTSHLRALAMSGYGSVCVLDGAPSGFDAHVPKPASIQQVKECLAQLVSLGAPPLAAHSVAQVPASP